MLVALAITVAMMSAVLLAVYLRLRELEKIVFGDHKC